MSQSNFDIYEVGDRVQFKVFKEVKGEVVKVDKPDHRVMVMWDGNILAYNPGWSHVEDIEMEVG